MFSYLLRVHFNNEWFKMKLTPDFWLLFAFLVIFKSFRIFCANLIINEIFLTRNFKKIYSNEFIF